MLRRLVVTIGIPLLLALLVDRVPLPGVTTEGMHATSANAGVFALGLMPIFVGYAVVELVAALVPSLARRRHAGPAARASLDLAARLLSLALGIFQAYGVARALESFARDEYVDAFGDRVSVPLVTATLVGGLCVQWVAARFVTRFGLVNGFVAIAAAGVLRGLATDLGRLFGLVAPPRGRGLMADLFTGGRALETPAAMALVVVGLAIAIAAVWAAVARAGERAPMTKASEKSAPYRAARVLVVAPWIPIPVGSIAALTLAASILMMPATLANFGLPTASLQSLLSRDAFFLPAYLVLTLAITIGLGALMHRPREMADLAARLGAKVDRVEARAAFVHALLPSFLFFVVLALAGYSARVGVATSLPIVAGALIDLARGVKAQARMPDAVTVWEERRASAVPVLRAALAENGIASEARGTAILSLFQVFVPYAPVEISVARADAERASALLAHLVAGAPAPDSDPSKKPIDDATEGTPMTTKRRTQILGALAIAAALAGACAHAPAIVEAPLADGGSDGAMESAAAGAKLEIVFVEDAIDPFADVPETSIPENSGIAIYSENAPLGPGKSVQNHFARLALRPGESRDAGTQRFRAWLANVKMPANASADARFGIEDVADYDEQTGKSTLIGLRTFLLAGEPVLTNRDVDTAAVGMQNDPVPTYYVEVTLTAHGASAFAYATEAWVQKRIAIVVNDRIESAPVVKSKIGGGHLSITMGAGDPEKQLQEAKALERGLRPSRRGAH